jgi:hypothetical protein
MSRRLMALSWLSVFIVAGLLGHLTAQKLHAIPTYSYCPILSVSCPTCCVYNDPLLGPVYCHFTTGSYSVCESASSGSCTNSKQYTCSGVQNSMADCSGIDFPQLAPCSCDYNACR